jgi:hypothetical protein
MGMHKAPSISTTAACFQCNPPKNNPTATPFTNTLPIRRLGLKPGESAEILAVYVRVPDLAVTTDRQRYTRLGERCYRYDSVDTDFTREVEVDERGLVVNYPGLFRRER